MSISLFADALCKSYQQRAVVNQLSFTAHQGDVVGLLGPNGAGKTTTMRMLTGFLLPDSGQAKICGFDVHHDSIKAKQRLGYLPEGAPLYPDMTVFEFLQFIARVRGMQATAIKTQIEAVIERIGLAQVIWQRIDRLSKGYKRRVGIAQAILHDPDVLIMDEPTDGLDPSQKLEIRDLIAQMASEKVIIMSTHILEEVDAVCNRVVLIAGGELLADSPVPALRQQYDNSLEQAFLTLTKGKQGRN